MDKNRLEENIRIVRSVAGGAAVYGVLKADGYGLGLVPMARTLAAQGVTRFAVTEAASVREILAAGIEAEEILLLRPMEREEIEPLLRTEAVTFSVGTSEDLAALAEAGAALGVRPRAHIEVDTGLGRFGFRWDEPGRICSIYENCTAVRFTGIYTHFAGKDCLVRRQYARFRRLLRALETAGIDPGLRHCCASSALLRHPEMAMDAVRVGSALLGRVSGGEKFGLREICRVEATIEAVRMLRAGDTVGYGARFRARRDMRVAVVDIGAVHGFGAKTPCGRQSFAAGAAELLRQVRSILRGGSPEARIGGDPVRALGGICSECTILDVTDVRCGTGDTAVLSLNPMFCRDVERIWLYGEDVYNA